MANKKTAKKAIKKVAKKTVRKVAKTAAKRTRPSKDSPYISTKTGKPVTEAYAFRNPNKVSVREAPSAIEDSSTGVIEAPVMYDADSFLNGPTEDTIFWAVVKKGIFTSRVVQLFRTRTLAEQEANQLDLESGMSLNSYVVQRAPLNTDEDFANSGDGVAL